MLVSFAKPASRSAKSLSVHGPVTVKQDAYALVGFNANYRISDQWSATLAVRNAFDEKYWANLDYNNYGEPRFVALTLRWKY